MTAENPAVVNGPKIRPVKLNVILRWVLLCPFPDPTT